MENPIWLTVFLLFIGAYVVLYIRNRTYLETFDDMPTKDAAHPQYHSDGSAHGAPNDKTALPPSVSSSVLPENGTSSDTYEVSAIFQNQGSRQATKKQISDAMSAYPLDWSVQGTGSQLFQEAQSHSMPSYSAASMHQEVADTAAQDEEEKKILNTYQPKSSKGLLQYSVDDVQSLMDKVYTKKGLVPMISKSKQGDNVWEITELKEKNPTIVWEDDDKSKIMRSRGEQAIQVPHPATDLAAGLNPFANPRQRVGNGTNDVTEMSRSLTEMFQPVQPVPRWQ